MAVPVLLQVPEIRGETCRHTMPPRPAWGRVIPSSQSPGIHSSLALCSLQQVPTSVLCPADTWGAPSIQGSHSQTMHQAQHPARTWGPQGLHLPLWMAGTCLAAGEPLQWAQGQHRSCIYFSKTHHMTHMTPPGVNSRGGIFSSPAWSCLLRRMANDGPQPPGLLFRCRRALGPGHIPDSCVRKSPPSPHPQGMKPEHRDTRRAASNPWQKRRWHGTEAQGSAGGSTCAPFCGVWCTGAQTCGRSLPDPGMKPVQGTWKPSMPIS
nr:uncharacterized protein LOC129144124 [Pan troglodytes]